MESIRFREVIRGKRRKVFQAEGRLRVRGGGCPETDRGWYARARRVQGALDMGEQGPLGNSWSLKRRLRL